MVAPIINAPIEDERTHEQNFRIIYTEESGATEYNVEIARDSGFTDTVIDQEGITELFWHIDPPLDDDEYFIRVRGKVASVWQSYSSTRTFRICEIAFPSSGYRLGAEGCGAYAAWWLRQHDAGTPSVLIVTNGNDSGAGSLRTALEASGPRIIMFEWSGIITLSTPINVNNPYFYLAGETAFRNDGGGILVEEAFVRSRTHDFVVKYYRGYVGDAGWTTTNPDVSSDFENIHAPSDNNDEDRKVHNGIFAHCEFFWSIDTNFEIWNNSDPATIDASHNITVQYTLIGEPLHNNSVSPSDNARAFLLGDHHENISYHHSAIFHTRQRGPHAKAFSDGTLTFEYINNLLYNARQAYRIGGAIRPGQTYHNIIGVTELVGNAGQENEVVHFFDISSQTHTVYHADNSATRSNGFLETGGNLVELTDPMVFPGRNPVTVHPRLEAVQNVLKYMGCYQNQTPQAERMRADWASGGTAGDVIQDQEDAPNNGYPTIDAMSSTDFNSTQGVSIPDDWLENNGFDPATVNVFDLYPHSRYTIIETYIHSLTNEELHNTTYRRRR